jgi:hypothetical protein
MIKKRISQGRSLHAVYAEARVKASLMRLEYGIDAGLETPIGSGDYVGVECGRTECVSAAPHR